MIYLDENEVTIKASKEAVVGEEYELNGEKYKVVDEKMLREMVKNEEDVTKVVTSRVTNMAEMSFSESFNQDIGSWDVSEVENMGQMFSGAKEFNQDIGSWNVSNVRYMWHMFAATKFNQDIGPWDVSKVEEMSGMFKGASNFNQDISSWDISRVDTVDEMFMGASSFNQNIGNWHLSKIDGTRSMFENATSFNQDIGSWDVSNVYNMDQMFKGASSFNQDISNWDINKVEHKYQTFNKATSFKSKFNPFRGKTKRKTFESLSSDDKKIVPKIKKLLGLRDYAKVESGIELLRSLNQANLYEPILDGCSINESGEFTRNRFFTGSGSAQPYLDFVMLSLIAYAPQDAKVHESLKVSNVKNLSLSTYIGGDMYSFHNMNSGENTNNHLPLENFKNLNRLEIINFNTFENIDFLVNNKNLKEIKFFHCRKIKNLDGLKNCVNLEEIEIKYCDSLPNISNIAELKNFLKQP